MRSFVGFYLKLRNLSDVKTYDALWVVGRSEELVKLMQEEATKVGNNYVVK
jgi:hypothetical protein